MRHNTLWTICKLPALYRINYLLKHVLSLLELCDCRRPSGFLIPCHAVMTDRWAQQWRAYTLKAPHSCGVIRELHVMNLCKQGQHARCIAGDVVPGVAVTVIQKVCCKWRLQRTSILANQQVVLVWYFRGIVWLDRTLLPFSLCVTSQACQLWEMRISAICVAGLVTVGKGTHGGKHFLDLMWIEFMPNTVVHW